MAHNHPKHLALTIAAAIGVVVLAFVIYLNVKPSIKPTAQAQVRQDAVKALVQAANTPNPACNPPAGAGHIGSCAPAQAFAAVSTIAVAAGDPDRVHGTLGVDVSSYQGCAINWAHQGVRFAYFKASEGVRYTDRCLRHNAASATAARLPFGVYDFLRPGGSAATAEARHFIAVVRAAHAVGQLPPVADVEANAGLSPAQVHAYVCAWHRTVARALRRPVTITYTGAWFWNPQVAGDSCGSRLWVSAYAFRPVIPHGWARYTFWQYSDGTYGPAPHIHGWDSDVFAGGQLRQLEPHRRKARHPGCPAVKTR